MAVGCKVLLRQKRTCGTYLPQVLLFNAVYMVEVQITCSYREAAMS